MASADFTIADVLDDARQLVERGWCQRRYGMSDDGHAVDPCSPDAVRWCATGAIDRASRLRSREDGCKWLPLWEAAIKALDRRLGTFRTAWNDHPSRTQEEVVDAFRRCVADLRGQRASGAWTKLDTYMADIEQVSA